MHNDEKIYPLLVVALLLSTLSLSQDKKINGEAFIKPRSVFNLTKDSIILKCDSIKVYLLKTNKKYEKDKLIFSATGSLFNFTIFS